MSDDELIDGIVSASSFLESEGMSRFAGILKETIVKMAGMEAERKAARLPESPRMSVVRHGPARITVTTAEGSRDWVPAECTPGPAAMAMLEHAAKYCSMVSSYGYCVSIGFAFAASREEFHRLWKAAIAEHEAAQKGAGG